MIKMPFEDIVKRIVENSDLSEKEIDDKIKSKTEQLAGLISKEGAAHIIANELGIKLFEATGRHKVKELLAGMRDIEVVGKVTQVFEVKEFETENRKGKLASLIIGDETGTIRTVIWGEQADIMSGVQPETILKVQSAYVRDNQGRLEMHLNDRSKILVNPEGETVGVVVSSFQKPEAPRKKIKDLQENDNNIDLVGTVVQVFDIRFFEVCPQCGKRARQRGDGAFYCDAHNSVTPDFSYVMNVFLDDGTDNIRAVFFRDQVATLLGKTNEEVVSYRTSPEKYEEVKTELLGNMVKLSGRVTKNSMFDRLEFVANSVSTDVNPEEEIAKLKEEIDSEKTDQ